MSSLPFQQNRVDVWGFGRFSRGQGGGLMAALACVLLLALPGCGNPSFDVQIEQLPPDTVGPGPNHRPGQPCLLCHGPYKGASPQMSLAGTVFKTITTQDTYGLPPDYAEYTAALKEATGLQGVSIKVYDPSGKINGVLPTNSRQVELKSLESGNFFFKTIEFSPNFPLGARMDCPDVGQQFTMISRISRDGSCNGCHALRKDQGSPGWLECNVTQ